VPEKHWMYRLAKRFWFYDFGAYREVAHDSATKARELRAALDPEGSTVSLLDRVDQSSAT
jgi:hypothetical protein